MGTIYLCVWLSFDRLLFIRLVNDILLFWEGTPVIRHDVKRPIVHNKVIEDRKAMNGSTIWNSGLNRRCQLYVSSSYMRWIRWTNDEVLLVVRRIAP
jgi:hypothetical protein